MYIAGLCTSSSSLVYIFCRSQVLLLLPQFLLEPLPQLLFRTQGPTLKIALTQLLQNFVSFGTSAQPSQKQDIESIGISNIRGSMQFRSRYRNYVGFSSRIFLIMSLQLTVRQRPLFNVKNALIDVDTPFLTGKVRLVFFFKNFNKMALLICQVLIPVRQDDSVH